MCGILGFSGPMDAELLGQALDVLAHRGPDDSGIYGDAERGVGLAHTRLSILDLSSTGHQPMVSDDGAVVLSYNGETYNFRELREELAGANCRFAGNSDTEVLLQLYRSEGEAMLSRINGIFALAIWDSERDALLVARDALGVKPLYYTCMDDAFAFASETKALLELVPAIGETDCAALDRYLGYLWCPGEGTPSGSIRKLGPGEALWVKDGRIERHFTWYRLPAFRARRPLLSREGGSEGGRGWLAPGGPSAIGRRRARRCLFVRRSGFECSGGLRA